MEVYFVPLNVSNHVQITFLILTGEGKYENIQDLGEPKGRTPSVLPTKQML